MKEFIDKHGIVFANIRVAICLTVAIIVFIFVFKPLIMMGMKFALSGEWIKSLASFVVAFLAVLLVAAEYGKSLGARLFISSGLDEMYKTTTDELKNGNDILERRAKELERDYNLYLNRKLEQEKGDERI